MGKNTLVQQRYFLLYITTINILFVSNVFDL